jgi:hypothetical protein
MGRLQPHGRAGPRRLARSMSRRDPPRCWPASDDGIATPAPGQRRPPHPPRPAPTVILVGRPLALVHASSGTHRGGWLTRKYPLHGVAGRAAVRGIGCTAANVTPDSPSSMVYRPSTPSTKSDRLNRNRKYSLAGPATVTRAFALSLTATSRPPMPNLWPTGCQRSGSGPRATAGQPGCSGSGPARAGRRSACCRSPARCRAPLAEQSRMPTACLARARDGERPQVALRAPGNVHSVGLLWSAPDLASACSRACHYGHAFES